MFLYFLRKCGTGRCQQAFLARHSSRCLLFGGLEKLYCYNYNKRMSGGGRHFLLVLQAKYKLVAMHRIPLCRFLYRPMVPIGFGDNLTLYDLRCNEETNTILTSFPPFIPYTSFPFTSLYFSFSCLSAVLLLPVSSIGSSLMDSLGSEVLTAVTDLMSNRYFTLFEVILLL